MIVSGELHMIIKNEKNEVYVCGNNGYGQLGLGDYKDRNIFEKVEYDFGEIKNIACGEYYTVIQNEKNEVYVCGYNVFGQLGLGDNIDRNKFERVEKNFGEIKDIICGANHVVIQNEKNEIYVCGNNKPGQLGLGDNNDRYEFEKSKKNFGEIKKIACGGYHTIIQNEKNEIYVCGWNHFDQLGLGDYKDRNIFEKVEYDFGKIKNIVCGENYTVIQNEKNEIYVCGFNGFGQLGLGDNKRRNKYEKVESNFGEIKKIACGSFHTVIQNEKNDIYVCGNNEFGQLGLGDRENRYKFEKVNFDLGEIKNIVCGGFCTIIQNKKNEIYACGVDYCGQLGLDDYRGRNNFEKVDTDDIFEKIYNFGLKLNIKEIVL